jgi:hypothetical protein
LPARLHLPVETANQMGEPFSEDLDERDFQAAIEDGSAA